MSKTAGSLRSLAQLILANVDILEADSANDGFSIPSLDEPYIPGSDFSNANPEVAKAKTIIDAAAQQLLHTIRNPHSDLLITMYSNITTVAIKCASEFNLVEILSEAGPEGLHIDEISAKCNANSQRIGPILRLLASNWIFKEVEPDVFANNRLSSVMHKGQTAETLQKSPTERFSKPESALSALLGAIGDECYMASTALHTVMADPSTAFSEEAKDAALPRAFGTDKACWEWFEEPAQLDRLIRFGVAMEGTAKLEPTELIVKGFEWTDLADGSVVVDVGGGIGTTSIALAGAYPKLKFVVQDRAPVVADGMKRCSPSLLSSGRLTFQEHNFFAPQPSSLTSTASTSTAKSAESADVFILRFITHDWSDKYTSQILARLRDAAKPTTKLYVVDKVVPYLSPSGTMTTKSGEGKGNEEGEGEGVGVFKGVPGIVSPSLPEEITNMSAGITYPHLSSIVMTLYCNGLERTLGQFISLFSSAGWKIEKIKQFDAFGQLSSQIIAVPA